MGESYTVLSPDLEEDYLKEISKHRGSRLQYLANTNYDRREDFIDKLGAVQHNNSYNCVPHSIHATASSGPVRVRVR